MSKEELEKLEREKYVVERKLTAAMHKEKRLQSELKRLTRSERTHRLCTRAGMLETFLKEPTTLTDDDVMELLTFIKCRMKPIRQTACDNVCSEVLPTRWTFYPLTEAATVDFCLSWYTLKMQRFTFWKMKPHPERSLI